ncbi:MAG: polymer-forming cytoskeletal protein [Betaproteobacteria bacterium]|nr:polymer-forming cytoskeletal protein [Betaproteobacteria bacterium]
MFKSSSKSDHKSSGLQLNANLTFIGSGCVIDGNVDCPGNLRLEGEVRGNLIVKGDVEIAGSGRMVGDTLSAENVVVHGQVKSCISARGLLRIHRQALVEGDVSAAALEIENGARFVGYSNTGVTEAEVLPIGQALIAGNHKA